MSGRQAKAARRARDAQVEEVWARIPDAGCKGLCARSCGPIGMSEPERDRIRRRHGVVIEDRATRPGTVDCPALVEGRCSVYADRPTVCRLWGASDPMPCPHGCAPAGGRLDDTTTAEIMRASLSMDTGSGFVVSSEDLAQVTSTPVGLLLLSRLLRGDWNAGMELRHLLRLDERKGPEWTN